MSKFKYNWFSVGDISSSATIVFDNLVNIAFIGMILSLVFKFPADIIYKHIIPGLSVGIVVNNLIYIFMGFKLAKKLGRNVTAFPGGLDAPSCIGLTTCIIGPAFLLFKSQGMPEYTAALTSWYVSCGCVVFLGLLKMFFALFANKIKSVLPTVALLGGIAGVAIGLIGFFPLLSLFQMPVVGLFVLAIVFLSVFAKYRLPGNLPAILVAIVFGTILYYLFQKFIHGNANLPDLKSIQPIMPNISLNFFNVIPQSIKFLSIAFPFGILVIFGTLSVTESAKVMGEEYSARSLLFVDGIATVLMGLFGGIAQTTAYAGFPAYKKLDARAGYLIINIIIVGLGSWLGLVTYFIDLVPSAVLAPVLLFIGIEIAMQVFQHSEVKHYPAAILAFFPSIARLLEIKLTTNPDLINIDKLNSTLYTITDGKLTDIMAIVYLGNGFIVTSTLWAATMYFLIERKIKAALGYIIVLSICSLFGIVHSINIDGSMYWFFDLPKSHKMISLEIAMGYLFFGLTAWLIYLFNFKDTSKTASY